MFLGGIGSWQIYFSLDVVLFYLVLCRDVCFCVVVVTFSGWDGQSVYAFSLQTLLHSHHVGYRFGREGENERERGVSPIGLVYLMHSCLKLSQKNTLRETDTAQTLSDTHSILFYVFTSNAKTGKVDLWWRQSFWVWSNQSYICLCLVSLNPLGHTS